MRKLGEQWVEKDGHMYKAVKKGSCDQNICSWAGLHVDKGLVVIDLGTVNEDGCLPSSWGEYPTIEAQSEEDDSWCVWAFLGNGGQVIKQEVAWGETEREAKDNWNRRS